MVVDGFQLIHIDKKYADLLALATSL